MFGLCRDTMLMVIENLSYSDRKRLQCLNKTFSELNNLQTNIKMRIASFDIGKKNFAYYVEEFNLNDLLKVRRLDNDIPFNSLRGKWNNAPAEMQSIVDTMCINGRRIYFGVENFQVDDAKYSTNLDNPTLKNFFKFMRNKCGLWIDCDVFVIEQQFVNLHGRHRGINMDAIKLGAITHAWLLEQYPHKVITTFGSTNKTQALGSPPKLNKAARKKWSTEKALEIFKKRDDREAIMAYQLTEKIKRKRINTEEKVQSYLIEFEDCAEDIKALAETIVRTRQKLDDISDTLIQLQAYKYLTFIST